MNIKVPKCNIASWSNVNRQDLDQLKPEEANRLFAQAVRREMNKFLYEPMSDSTTDRIREDIVHQIRNSYGDAAIHSVDIDYMRDLEGKSSECMACAETGSYEEYKIKRAAQNLPDDAGSEKEWYRMSQYGSGQVLINVSFSPLASQEIYYTVKLCS